MAKQKPKVQKEEVRESFYKKNMVWIIAAVVVLALVIFFIVNNTNKPVEVPQPQPTGPSWHQIGLMDGTSKSSPVFEVKGKLRVSYDIQRNVEYAIFPIYIIEENQKVPIESINADFGFSVAKSFESKVSSGKYYIKVNPVNVDSWNIKIEDYY